MPIAATIGAAVLPWFLSLFGGGGSSSSSSSSSSQPEANVNYTAPVAGAQSNFNWQAGANDWRALGVTLLFLLALGSFSATRPLAIGIAIVIALLLLLAKAG